MRLFYLHGFASSPHSGKARFFADRLAARGLRIDSPDLNEPAFETLTVTRMLQQLDALIDAGPLEPVALIGSSLGGLVALHSANRRNAAPLQARPVARLVLLAPALGFADDLRRDPALEDWRRVGSREVFHYGEGRLRRVEYALVADALQYDSSRVDLDIPILIFHGRRDAVVPPAWSADFARSRPNVTLRLLDDDHRLQACLDEIWRESASFLGLDRAPA